MSVARVVRSPKRVQRCLEQQLPALRAAVRVVDVATPLTLGYGALVARRLRRLDAERAAPFSHVQKRLPGLSGFYMAGQWVEPGGGVPLALMSGRQVVQLLCQDTERGFRTPVAAT